MTADVYAGDVAPPEGSRKSQPLGAATFSLVADAHSDLLLRVAAVLNLLNVAPRVFQLESLPEGTAAIRAVVDCAELQAELIARKLQQLTCVRDVSSTYAVKETRAAQ
jgi:hypothetical protein